MFSRLTYRTRQFWGALAGPRIRIGTEDVLPYLSSLQIALFRRMQISEQAHAYRVLERLKAAGQTDPDLLVAALLHDAGKILYPLSLLDRVIIVLGNHFFQQSTVRWSKGTPIGLRRPFVVATMHPGWGADLARQAGVSPHSLDLIRRHHDPLSTNDSLLAALQAADNAN